MNEILVSYFLRSLDNVCFGTPHIKDYLYHDSLNLIYMLQHISAMYTLPLLR